MTDGPAAEAEIHRLQEEARGAEAARSQICEDPQVIEIHPAAVARYVDALTYLSGRLSADNRGGVLSRPGLLFRSPRFELGGKLEADMGFGVSPSRVQKPRY